MLAGLGSAGFLGEEGAASHGILRFWISVRPVHQYLTHVSYARVTLSMRANLSRAVCAPAVNSYTEASDTRLLPIDDFAVSSEALLHVALW